MPIIVIEQRKDGTGRYAPFGKYTRNQSEATVRMFVPFFKENKRGDVVVTFELEDEVFPLTSDGKFIIPRWVFDSLGVRGSNGRLRIGIQFSIPKGGSGWRRVFAKVHVIGSGYENFQTGAILPSRGTPYMLD